MSNNAFKDRLMPTLHTAVQHFNATGDPNTAVIKAAESADFNPEQTTRLVEAFNTARTIYHYKVASDRTSTFALADVSTVLGSVFGKSPESTEKAAEAYDYYATYNYPETNYYTRATTVKVATAPREEDLPSLDTLAYQATQSIQDLRRTAKIAEDEARIMASCAAKAFNKIALELSRDYPDVARDKYTRLAVMHNTDESRPAVVKLAEFIPDNLRYSVKMFKSAAARPVIDDTDLSNLIDLFKEANDAMAEEANLLALSGMFDKEANNFEREWLVTIGVVPETPKSTLCSLLNLGLSKVAQPRGQQGGRGQGGGQGGGKSDDPGTKHKKDDPYISIVKGTNPTDAVADYFFKSVGGNLADAYTTGVKRIMASDVERAQKGMNAEINNIHRQIMLQDLMTTDPVLSEEPPENVANAYSALLQAAPEVANNKEVVRAILRQSVHSVAISPYDAEVWTKLEKNLQSIRGTAATPMGQNRDGGKNK